MQQTELEILDCPHCPNQGWWADQQPNYWTGDAEWVQVQCEWCWTTPNSRFNIEGDINERSENS